VSKAVESGIHKGKPFGSIMIMIKKIYCDSYAVVRVANWVKVIKCLSCVNGLPVSLCEEISVNSWPNWCSEAR